MAPIPCALALGVAGLLAYQINYLPALDVLERIQPGLITRVYDKDLQLLREYYEERRIWTPLERIPLIQSDAVLAVEDHNFFRHWGVDLKALPGAFLPALFGERIRGGSTLTQQLAKNLFLSSERSLSRKVKEFLLAVKIEQTYTKKEILEFYMNQVYLGAGAHGFQAASERYFSLPLDSLKLNQQAILAGLLQRPEAYRPDLNPERARLRGNTVLRLMEEAGYISPRQREAALRESPGFKPGLPESQQAGPYFAEAVRQSLVGLWGDKFLYTAGLEVRTTLDRKVQGVADSSFKSGLKRIQNGIRRSTMRELGMSRLLNVREEVILKNWNRQYARFDSLFLRGDTAAARRRFPEERRYRHAQGAVIVLENATGAVRALVGGENFAESEYNRAIQALRSPGSAFKPIVYAMAVDKGASPGQVVLDEALSISDPNDTAKTWRPQNIEYDFEGPITLRRALYRSRNIPAIKVAQEYGLDSLVAYARRFGLLHQLPPVPSLAIGSGEASLLEMTSAFSVFPNMGMRVEPFLMDSVLDRTGLAIYKNKREEARVLKKESAWILCGMLRDVNIRGTAADVWASGFQQPSGGKTGTTDDYRDAWYIGYTRRYTVGVWIGADNHMPLGSGHTGTSTALPIWLAIMRDLHKGLKPLDFERPKGVEEVSLCSVTGLVPQGFCGAPVTDYCIRGRRPTKPCDRDLHSQYLSARHVFENERDAKDTTMTGWDRFWRKMGRQF